MLEGFRHLPGHLAEQQQKALLASVRAVLAEAPLYTPTMPRTGRPMSVRMSSCGPLGWVTDKERGYRYQATHPATGRPWPAMPQMLLSLWQALACYPQPPEACLVNWYGPGARLGLHRDEDEQDRAAPVLSISLGADAIFAVGGLSRSDPRERIMLSSGDVVVLGGRSRMAYHGIERILGGDNGLLGEGERINLTLRRVGKA
jgi:alkylated DNA repair protein (DNA oxidative demethylase)